MMSYKSLEDVLIEMIDMIRAPDRSRVSEFAAKYRKVYSPGAPSGDWDNDVTPYMVEPMDNFTSRAVKGMIFVGPAQSGKALDIATPIATPTGWTTMGDLQVGDVIFSKTGDPSKVKFATEVMHGHKCFHVQFDDGTALDADADHKWEVVDCHRKGLRVITTTEMRETYLYGKKSRSRYSIPMPKPISCPTADLPIDPYMLGVWLGDGHSYSGWVYINAEDTFIADKIRTLGYEVVVEKVNAANTLILKIDPSPNHNRREGSLRHLLCKHGLIGNKHIPIEYLRASTQQRLALLRGLNDTDAYSGKNGVCEFTSSIPQLADGYVALCATLGIKVRRVLRDSGYKDSRGEFVTCKPSHRITYTPRQSLNPFSLPRKAAMVKADDYGRPTYTGSRAVVSVAPVASRPVRCIQIDHPSHVFLAGTDMIPTHNTDSLILNTVAYCVKSDPMDMMVYCPTQKAARDFSIRRIDRLHIHSPVIGDMLLPDRDADNTFDKRYKSGMILTISYPTVTELAGRPIGRIVMTDRDRMDDDIGGDGEPYDLASQRANSFGSLGMTVAESSPSREVEDPRWIPKTPHEGPPCKGIVGLYNRGDRRRWYWPCPHCDKMFEGEFEYLVWDTTDPDGNELSNPKKAASVRMICPHCGQAIHPNERYEMNLWGEWLPESQYYDDNGRKCGEPPHSAIISYWLKGVAAAFSTWKKLVTEYLDAERDYENTKSEEALKKFYNNNLGEPYRPKSMHTMRTPESLRSKAESYPKKVVPNGTRFLVGTSDVQKDRFVVVVWGVMAGHPFDMVAIDRFELFLSDRKDEKGNRLPLRPHAYLEDWHVLKRELMQKTYDLEGDPTRAMGLRLTVCDSNGKNGVTTNAYNFYRDLRDENLHGRFLLLKGSSNPNAPRVTISYPDSNRKDRHAGARGDVPVMIIQSDSIKDTLDGRLEVTIPGRGMIHYPEWLPDEFFTELCAETRTAKGWVNSNNERNEAWDLACYCIAACVSPYLSVEKLDWDKAPTWAAEWDSNALVFNKDTGRRFVPRKKEIGMAELGKLLA